MDRPLLGGWLKDAAICLAGEAMGRIARAGQLRSQLPALEHRVL